MTIFRPILSNLEDENKIIQELTGKLNISPITAKILINRGICSLDQAMEFLNPSLDKLLDPFELQDMDKAVKRIEQAAKNNEHITIYGDYDVDGITAASLLYKFLTKNGCSVDVYLPDRHIEGYGINIDALDIIHGRGTDLLISVDCGITAIEETEYANKLGMDVIITDHHQCQRVLPSAVAVVNPSREPKLYNKYQLAGVGVAGKLVHALGGVKALEEYLDLIALGTIADVVPLIGENRIFAALGLEKINAKPRPGIQALIEVSRLGKSKIDAGKVAFGLAPRLNAAGRMAHPRDGFLLLVAKNMEEAMPLAAALEENNKKRQDIEAAVIRDAEEMIENDVDLSRDRIMVLGQEGWDSGVIGIAASKLTDKYNRPCLLISISGDEGTGSGRSIEGFDLYKALSSCSELFMRFGGHQQAAGFSISVDNIDKLREHLLDYTQAHIDDDMLLPKFYFDTVLNPSDINYNLIKELERLDPHGVGNPSPSFLIADAIVEDSRKVGREGNHLKMSIGLGQRLWDAIAFNAGSKFKFLEPNQRVSLLAGLDRNEWKGVSKIQFMVQHVEMHIDGVEDCIDFLKPFYFKFFDAFFASFMYNKNYKTNKEDVKIEKKVESVDDILYKFKESRLGNLLLINTYSIAKEILARFAREGILNNIAVSYGDANIDKGIGVNSCVLAPSFYEIPYRYYKNIYVIDEEHRFWNVHKHWEREAEKVIRLAIGSKDIVDIIEEEWSHYRVDRSDFVCIYKWLQSLTPGRNLWQNWDELLDRYNSSNKLHRVNGFQMRLILAVFEELDFINVNSGHRFLKVSCVQNPRRRNLNESRLYRYYKTWIGSE